MHETAITWTFSFLKWKQLSFEMISIAFHSMGCRDYKCTLIHSNRSVDYEATHINSLRYSICVSKIDLQWFKNDLSLIQHQVIIWTNAGLFFIGALGTHFGEYFNTTRQFAYKKINLEMLSAKCLLFRSGLNMFMTAIAATTLISIRPTMTARPSN